MFFQYYGVDVLVVRHSDLEQEPGSFSEFKLNRFQFHKFKVAVPRINFNAPRSNFAAPKLPPLAKKKSRLSRQCSNMTVCHELTATPSAAPLPPWAAKRERETDGVVRTPMREIGARMEERGRAGTAPKYANRRPFIEGCTHCSLGMGQTGECRAENVAAESKWAATAAQTRTCSVRSDKIPGTIGTVDRVILGFWRTQLPLEQLSGYGSVIPAALHDSTAQWGPIAFKVRKILALNWTEPDRGNTTRMGGRAPKIRDERRARGGRSAVGVTPQRLPPRVLLPALSASAPATDDVLVLEGDDPYAANQADRDAEGAPAADGDTGGCRRNYRRGGMGMGVRSGGGTSRTKNDYASSAERAYGSWDAAERMAGCSRASESETQCRRPGGERKRRRKGREEGVSSVAGQRSAKALTRRTVRVRRVEDRKHGRVLICRAPSVELSSCSSGTFHARRTKNGAPASEAIELRNYNPHIKDIGRVYGRARIRGTGTRTLLNRSELLPAGSGIGRSARCVDSFNPGQLEGSPMEPLASMTQIRVLPRLQITRFNPTSDAHGTARVRRSPPDSTHLQGGNYDHVPFASDNQETFRKHRRVTGQKL
ncbi:hypothetical protein B0H16DRAFT_1686612 [Mycena metata]|uniref:Uncharacterized protein n=1 Tax=Mycena metata TaxID=1033252 RepID=A0AAD7NM67_9AGAR|nr:hypothetical protein B0H16DRAFT_1686612 [Mycena metata]